MMGIDVRAAKSTWTAALVLLGLYAAFLIRETLLVVTISVLFACVPLRTSAGCPGCVAAFRPGCLWQWPRRRLRRTLRPFLVCHRAGTSAGPAR